MVLKKTLRMATLAGQLQHFAQSVDLVNDATFDAVRLLVYKYVSSLLGAKYFEVMQAQAMDDDGWQTHLRTFWSSQEKHHLWPIRNPDQSFFNPVTHAYAEGCAIWLVDAGKDALDGAGDSEDHWSKLKPSAPYRPADPPVRTMIAVPMRCRTRLGIYVMEIEKYIDATDVAKDELLRLAEALAILFELWQVGRSQSQYTASAIADLNELLISARFPRLAQPHFFVAFSQRADPRVVGTIKEVLDEFSDKLEFTDWQEMTESGNINLQVAQEISHSRFGICYLSEPASDHRYTWEDNKNVVFEAGMLHERTRANAETSDGQPTGWIPIREENSPPAPFDFAAERIVYVPRTAAGALNEPRFREMLTRRIIKLLDEP